MAVNIFEVTQVQFQSINSNRIIDIAKKVSNYIYYKYNCKKRNLEKDDLEQEACILILETCGDLEKNFDGDELSRMIYLRARINVLKHIGTQSKVVSIYGYYKKAQDRTTKGNGKNIDLVVKDENADTEKEALEKTASVFEIDKETMLETLKEELLKRGKVKQTDKGEYVLGD